MDVWGTITRWAGDAWSGLTSVGGAAESALQAIWSFIQSVGAAVSWLLTALLAPGVLIIYAELTALNDVIRNLRDASDRTAWWIWTYMISPVQSMILLRLSLFEAVTVVRFQALTNLVYVLHLVGERYTDIEVGAERQQRQQAVASARAYALALTNQLHQAIETEAASAYKSGNGIRTTLLEQLADDLNVRGILDSAATKLLASAIDTLATIDDPVLAAAADRIISELVKASGIGGDLGDLIDRLLFPGAGGPQPKNLPGVIEDVAHRLSEIEDWISEFMLAGGPELEDEGRQLKSINSLVFDAAILGFFGAAVTEPQAWATAVSDTAGNVANATLGTIIDLISHV